MKVKYAERTDRGMEAGPTVVRKREASFREPSFDHQYREEGRRQLEEHLEDLKNRLEQQGNILARKADIGELSRYRTLISEILCEVVGNAYAFQKENAFDKRGRHFVYATVRKIDEKLEELGREILRENRDEIEILAKIDDIRGLLLDILS
ncbi:YaaR family protein [Papillibacter cinnamivorans]|uniref:DUF327 domain-containing protein n=1 Tax=Papillibacter cinnamivorans DSM 12816 TaxID=1122930 RepID=A0A1W1YGM9_9FIRM|nr:YaaR family protein [Papillibacter cinnamivorans]SMC35296.1 hypothetical protein SAMN02745168_0393 [Papillibacter cinnamivorans DSM 12816]